MRICHVIASLDARFGGPSRTVYALCQALARQGHETELCTLDPAAAGTRQEGRLRISTFRRQTPQLVGRSTTLAAHLQRGRYDVVHNHALWLRPLHYANRAARASHVPLVVSPRGMMSTWAWAHHAGRKMLARRLVHPGALEGAAGWHVTSETEAEDVRRLGFTQPLCVSPNAVEFPAESSRAAAAAHWQRTCPDLPVGRTALFYSRFHAKKRVIELIDLWLQRAPPGWQLLLVGLPEEFSVRQLEQYVLRASAGDRVRVHDGTGAPPPYPVASVFLLPSHSENFGMVIAEAMAYGLPVLVTDSTPWLAVNEREIGWCVPWEHYGDALSAALSRPVAELRARGDAASRWVAQNFSWDQSARELAAFYQHLAQRHLAMPGLRAGS